MSAYFKHIKGLLWKFSVNLQFFSRKKKISFSSRLQIGKNASLFVGNGAKIGDYGLIRMGKYSRLEIGRNTLICRFAEISVNDNAVLKIGDDVYIGERANIRARESIEIGSHTQIAQGVSLIGGQYLYKNADIPIKKQGFMSSPIHIGSDAWLGVNVVVLPGRKIGKGAVVGAGSVVSRNIPDYAIAVGSPAKVSGYRQGGSHDSTANADSPF